MHIERILRMGCMAGAGYAFGTAMKADPKLMAIAWLCGEVAVQLLQRWTLIPQLSETLSNSLGGTGVAYYLTKHKIIGSSFESGLIAVIAFTGLSVLLEKMTASLLSLNNRHVQYVNDYQELPQRHFRFSN
ncbi:hypothetical protein PNK_0369 [Candidatus Protochlamydia naegleriophila]|uniref:Uncharacterized protein n=2 Tax=Candidatus Protochlamydia naegleriophila TaxID=389348 RepID=A0A0U5EPQ2_9BACT|nr:hypothetical protein PNK_0369 [Candidatus Protochlamydia naegleriophila]